jgi:hypothetical protein
LIKTVWLFVPKKNKKNDKKIYSKKGDKIWERKNKKDTLTV